MWYWLVYHIRLYHHILGWIKSSDQFSASMYCMSHGFWRIFYYFVSHTFKIHVLYGWLFTITRSYISFGIPYHIIVRERESKKCVSHRFPMIESNIIWLCIIFIEKDYYTSKYQIMITVCEWENGSNKHKIHSITNHMCT